MKFLKSLIPSALKALDNQWLTQHPWLWSTKVHYHLWMLLLIDALLGLLAFALPINPKNIIDLEHTFNYLFVLQATYLVFWIYRQVRFNVTREFGQRFLWMPQAAFGVRWFSILLIVSMGYVPVLILNVKVANNVSDQDFAQDLNNIALGEQYFEGESNYSYFRSLEEYKNRDSLYNQPGTTLMSQFNAYVHKRNAFQRKLKEQRYDNLPDSTRLVYQDSMQYFNGLIDSIKLNCPRYLTHFYIETDTTGKLSLLDRDDLQRLYIESLDWSDDQHLEVIKNYLTSCQRYGRVFRYGPEYWLRLMRGYRAGKSGLDESQTNAYEDEYYYSGAYRPGSARHLSKNIDEVWGAKFWTNYYAEATMLLIFGVIALVLSNLLYIFRSVNWRWFLASIATVVVLSILIPISVIAVDSVSSIKEEYFIMNQLLLIFIILCLLAAGGLRLAHHSARSTTALVIVVSILPFLFLGLFGWYEIQFDPFGVEALKGEIRAERYLMKQGESTLEVAPIQNARLKALEAELRQTENLVSSIYWLCFIGGMLVYYFLLLPMVDWVFRKYHALPQLR